MLVAVRRHLRPGGQALIGEMIWEGTPSAAALAALGVPADSVPDLAGLVQAFQRHGLEPSFGHVNTDRMGRLRVQLDRLARRLGRAVGPDRRGPQPGAHRRPRAP